MTIFYRIRGLVRWLFRRDEIERALDQDLDDYIERSAAEKMRAGMSEAEARRAARIELGGVEQTKDSVRASLSVAAIDNTLADLFHAFRTLSRQKTFTAVAVLTLALGVGVNVAIFSLAEQVLLRPLPVSDPDRLVNFSDPGTELRSAGRMDPRIWSRAESSQGGGVETVFSYRMFRDLEREQEPFIGLAAHTFYEGTLSTGELARAGTVVFVSGSYFSVLGLQPALGRLLGPQDDAVDGQADSVVLSHAYWRSEFGANPDVLGQTLTVDGVRLSIVGVTPEGFHGTAVSARPSVFVPITISLTGNVPGLMASDLIPNHDRRDLYWVHLFARLKTGVTREAALPAMNSLYRTILSEVEAPLLTGVDEQQREAFRSRPLVLARGAQGQTSSGILGPARNSLTLLFAASGAVLLLCCANVAGLILLRATSRSGEIAVRASLGATRGRLTSLLLAESLVLALPAGLLSLPVAWSTLRAARLVPGISPAAPDVSFSGAAALVALGVAVVAAVAVGLLPVRGVTRTKPGNALQAYGARHTATKAVARFRTALATAQVALSMALLAMMGVFAQSLADIARLDLGFDLDSVVMFSVVRPDGLTIQTDPSFGPRLTEQLEAIPGVSSVASSWHPLLEPGVFIWNIGLQGADAGALPVSGDSVSPNFFRTFGTEFLAGRDFNDEDNAAPGLGKAIVNHRFAERFGLRPDAIIGRTISGMGAGSEIVGVIGDLRSGRITGEIEPQVFFSRAVPATFYVRSARPPEDLINAIRDTVARVDPTRPVSNLQTMEQQFEDNVAVQRFFAGTSTAFAVLATALAALGLYGVLAYSVAQRSREIGLRVALGAPTDRIRAMVLRQVTRMAVIGIVLGAAASVLLGRAARAALFGVGAGDPLALTAAAVVLAAVALGAAYIPARRASRVDPMTVLRYE
jgi:putative ABC transport system permease protein